MQREYLRAIEIVHVVNSEHQGGTVQVQEFIMINGDVLGAEVRVAHGLRVHVNEGTRLHVQIGHSVKGVVSQDEVIEGREEKEVVERLLVPIGEEIVFYN